MGFDEYEEATSDIDEMVDKDEEAISVVDERVDEYEEATSVVDETADEYEEATSVADETVDEYEEATSVVDETVDEDEEATRALQATIELRFPVNSGRNSEIQQLLDGHFKVRGEASHPSHQVIQCHLDPSQGDRGEGGEAGKVWSTSLCRLIGSPICATVAELRFGINFGGFAP